MDMHYTKWTIQNGLVNDKQKLFKFLTTNEYDVRHTAKFFTKAMLIREFSKLIGLTPVF